jgi:type IV pilus assembly protein PilA
MERQGFTLIELMIAVAIIGILAAIAIPNFLKYEASSKQSEAKMNLGSLGTSAESFHAEMDTYHAGDLDPLGRNSLEWIGVKGTARYDYYYDGQLYYVHTQGVGGNAADGSTSFANETSFEAVATGDIGKNTAGSDEWTFTNLRVLHNAKTGY